MVKIADILDVIGKWATIPFGLTCVLAAGAALNLEDRLRDFTQSDD